MFNKYHENPADEELVKRSHDKDISKVWLRFFGRTTAHGLPHWRRSKGRFLHRIWSQQNLSQEHISMITIMHFIQHNWLPNIQLNRW